MNIVKGKRHLTGITVDTFTHPLDLAAYERLMNIPMLPQVVAAMHKYAAEIPVLVDLYSSSIKVTNKSYSRLHDILMESCQILDMSPPEMFVRQAPVANAFAIGVKNPAICLYSGLLEILDDEEIQCVIAHELGHIKARHVLYQLMVILSVDKGRGILGSILPGITSSMLQVIKMAFLSWMRKCELTADRAALLVVQDPQIQIRTCMKLAGGVNHGGYKMDYEDFLAQGKLLEGMIKVNDIPSAAAALNYWMANIKITHPFPVPRASIAYDWGKSNEYRDILDGHFNRYPTKTCPKCSCETTETNETCPSCLHKFHDKDMENKIYCYECGHSIIIQAYKNKDLKFCPECGSNLNEGKNIFNKYQWV